MTTKAVHSCTNQKNPTHSDNYRIKNFQHLRFRTDSEMLYVMSANKYQTIQTDKSS